MGDEPASLLTKKQRDRIRSEFADLAEGKRRRDEQRIRERVRAGLLDFRVLADYPDRQLELAVEDLSDEELRAALADATLFVERLRLLRDVERDEVVVRARGRAERLADESPKAPSLARVDLRTAAEVRAETEASLREELEPGRWDRRADVLWRVGVASVVALFGVWVVEQFTAVELLGSNALFDVVYILAMFGLAGALSGILLIKFAQTCKHAVVPGLLSFVRDPAGAVTGLLDRLRQPGETLRESWEEL